MVDVPANAVEETQFQTPRNAASAEEDIQSKYWPNALYI
jgi:hypothetical protein